MSHLNNDRTTGARHALVAEVLAHSLADDWEVARREWVVEDYEEDEDCEGVCVCGQRELRHLYTIRNAVTASRLNPVGSECINYFGVSAMSRAATEFSRLKELEKASGRGALNLKHDLSRAKIELLWGYGVIDGREAAFLTAMFNRRREMTVKQGRWADALLSRARAYLIRTAGEQRRRVDGRVA